MKSVSLKYFSAIFIFTAFICSSFADTVHFVQKGETLYSISRKYNATIQSICDANNIGGTDIKVGQKLTIPDGNSTSVSKADEKDPVVIATTPAPSTDVYTVKKGDTWYGIARNHSINVNDLYKLNGVDSSAALKIGQKVKVPGKGQTIIAKETEKETKKPSVETNPVTAVSDPHNYSGKKGDSNLLWPVTKPDVLYVNGKVSGVSLSAKKDESVNAIKSGTVMFSGTYRGFGNVVFIQSKTGHIYAYTGLGKILVNKGDYIDFKSQIGTAGIDAYSDKPQISLMVFQNGLPIDPAKAPRG